MMEGRFVKSLLVENNQAIPEATRSAVLSMLWADQIHGVELVHERVAARDARQASLPTGTPRRPGIPSPRRPSLPTPRAVDDLGVD